MGLCPNVKHVISPVSLRAGGSDPASFAPGRLTPAEEGALRPRPSILPVQLAEASNLSVPDLARTERKGVRQLTGRGFFPPPFCDLKECLSLTFHRGKQLFIKSVQRPTWLASDAIKGSQHFQIKYINRPL